MANRNEIVHFLEQFKSCLMLNFFAVKDREKNMQGLLDLGITPGERKEVLFGLKPEDYIAGPKPDDTDYTKEIWEFGKTVAGEDVYIKLRLCEIPKQNHRLHALVWSFHRAEYPLRYPLRGDKSC